MAISAERVLPERLAERIRPYLDRIDQLLFARDGRGEAGRMSIIAFLIRVFSAAIAFLSQVFLARWMGTFEYGIFVVVWVSMIIIGNLACLGFHTSVIRFIPEYRENGRMAEWRGVMVASRLTAIISATVIAVLGMTGLWLLRGAFETYWLVPFYLGLTCLPMIALSDVLQGIARANAWAVAALAPIYVTRPLLILGFMALAIALGLPATAEIAVGAAVLATYVTTISQMVQVTGRADARVPAGPRRMLMREWLVVSLPIFLVESFFFMLTNADVLLIGLFLSPDEVAIYFATVKTLALVHFVYFAVKAGVAQRYAGFVHSGDQEGLARFARETVAWTFWPSLAMGALVLLAGWPMLRLFGAEYVSGYPLLFVLVLAVVLRAAAGPAESVLTMSGNQSVCAGVYGATLALNIGLAVLLLPVMGLWGAAISTGSAMVFEAAALSYIVWRRLGIVMPIFLPASRGASA